MLQLTVVRVYLFSAGRILSRIAGQRLLRNTMARTKHALLPSTGDYYVSAIEALKAHGGSLTIEEMEEDVAERLHLSDKARAVPHGDGRRTQFQYDLAWARTYLKWAGAVENSERGVWSLTSRGRMMSEEELRGLWKRIVAEQRARRKATASPEPHLESRVENRGEPPELSWKERLIEVLLTLEASAFERLCQRLLRESGFTKVEVTGKSGDGGIDGVGVLRINLLSFHVLFQSKRFKGSVGASAVRDFRGAMVGRADKGLILTTGTYTADARREATRDGAPAIDLIDGDALCDLLRVTKVGVAITLIERVEVDETALRLI
jgi:restriction system protein